MNNAAHTKYPPAVHYGLLVLLLLVLFVWQTAPGEGPALFGVRPVPVVMLVALCGVLYGEFTGGVLGLLSGLLMDVYTVPSVAFHVVLLTALGMICGLAVKHLLMHNFYAILVLCLGCSAVYFVAYFIVFQWILGDSGWLYVLRFSLPAAVYTWAVGVVLYPLLRWLHRHQ